MKDELMMQILEIDKAEEQDILSEERARVREELKAKLGGILNNEATSGLFSSGRVAEDKLRRRNEHFSIDEIKHAVFQLGSDKAPGPDGYSIRFYQTFWDTVKDDLFNLFQDLYEGRLSTTLIDYSYICLIPKKVGAERASDFRPISLLNGIQKIVSKVLANRLVVVLNDLISPSQSAFVKGRNITDAYATVSELIGWGCKKGIEGVGIKVDFEKAYDRVHWPFLFSILRWWGFDNKWCGWMEQCVCNAKVAILVNGEPTNWIKTKRGVRQGDPLSPFLFLLVAECLAKMTNVATANNLLKGIGPSDESRTTLILVDDTFLFYEARKKYIKNHRLMWSLFEWASGMKINREKSELYYIGQIEGRAARLANLLECKVGTLPTTYLGFPLSPRRPTKAVWTEIIQKIQRRIEGWQAKLLSRGGRLILVNAVLTNLPLYFLSVFKAPKWVIKRIEALRRDFFWNGVSNSLGKGCLVAWKSVCLSKIQGGLGILDIAIMNRALLIKWWWRFHTEPQLHHVLPKKKTFEGGKKLQPLLILVMETLLIFGRTDGTVNHVLAQCVFTKFILVMGKRWQDTRHSLLELATCWWTMWKARNDMIFRNIQLDPLELLKSWELCAQTARRSGCLTHIKRVKRARTRVVLGWVTPWEAGASQMISEPITNRNHDWKAGTYLCSSLA
ncbi:LINE-1 retrotransposable element ORF2 protein [Ananas comosus]|uniref:LINE-1 retrotransposable element ORF2 protein n=1 Tax=Ananas comosus TaxID=4615 RepID=A0A199UNR3_ANACO|nr:LINE-1 retrotransposable element ORF2 protein [Ananas comosus]